MQIKKTLPLSGKINSHNLILSIDSSLCREDEYVIRATFRLYPEREGNTKMGNKILEDMVEKKYYIAPKIIKKSTWKRYHTNTGKK